MYPECHRNVWLQLSNIFLETALGTGVRRGQEEFDCLFRNIMGCLNEASNTLAEKVATHQPDFFFLERGRDEIQSFRR